LYEPLRKTTQPLNKDGQVSLDKKASLISTKLKANPHQY